MKEFRIRIDLRDLTVAQLDEAVQQFGGGVGFLLTAWQWTAWNRDRHVDTLASRMLIVVPDFLYYARLGSTGQAKEIIKLPDSLRKVVQSAFTNVGGNLRNLPGLATGDFWAAAETLASYDMGLLGRDFPGEVILQYNLADFTWLFEQEDFLKSFARLGSRASGWGVATQQISMALSASARWNNHPGRIMYTSGVKRSESDLVTIALRDCFPETRLTLDVTQWPTGLICGDDAGELRRAYDDEWLVTYSTGQQLLNLPVLLTK